MKSMVVKSVILLVLFGAIYRFGIVPMLEGSFVTEARQRHAWASGLLPSDDAYDVVVFGGEPAGVSAAISASRSGAMVLQLSDNGNLGGIITNGYQAFFEQNLGLKGIVLTKGIYREIYKSLKGGEFNIEEAERLFRQLAAKEKNLKVLYNVKLVSVKMTGSKIDRLEVTSDGKPLEIKGRMFVDASSDGELAFKCEIRYFSGKEDLNMRGLYSPVKINFMVSGVDGNKFGKLYNRSTNIIVNTIARTKEPRLKEILKGYAPSDINVTFQDLRFVNQGNGEFIINSINIHGVDYFNEDSLKNAAELGEKEAKRFVGFLRAEMPGFEKCRFKKMAKQVYASESRHFTGEYTLDINDIINNHDFYDKIAVASRPVEFYTSGRSRDMSVLGTPVQYGIPLRCLVPLKADNLFIAGKTASFSSLASGSVTAIPTLMAMGEASGMAAVYSIVKNIAPRDIARNRLSMEELTDLLKARGVYLESFYINNSNSDNWSYTSVKTLYNLGLIIGGPENNLRFTEKADTADFINMLLNGITRLKPEAYTLELDARLRAHMDEGKLTKEKAAQILLDLYDNDTGSAKYKSKSGADDGSSAAKSVDSSAPSEPFNSSDAYRIACEKGYFSKAVVLSLSQRNVLLREDLYELGAYTIMKYTRNFR